MTPQRCRNARKTFTRAMPGDGTRNREAFEAGCQCRDSGATEGEALAYVEAGRDPLRLDLREARDAVRSAFKQPPREPITKGHGAPMATATRAPRFHAHHARQ